MELQGLVSLSHSQTTFILGYFTILNFLLNVQATNRSADSNGNVTEVEQCCSTEMTLPNVNKSVFSFTERFIWQRTSRHVDIKRLIMNYTSICPLQETCGVDIDKQFLFQFSDEIRRITGCRRCACHQSCIYIDNCCPGTHYGYVGYKCINTILYPNPKTTEISYYMVGSCLENYNENKTIIELCSKTTEPCTGTESGLVYQNKYCGKCNKELGCISWRLKFECAYAKSFEDNMASFSSPRAVKEAFEEYKCRIRFQNPAKYTLNTCSDSKRVLVDRCNITGLWAIYDSDIEWACKNLIFQYKTFKNVFCYICNPSQANIQTASLMDSCSPAKEDRDDLKAEIKKACELFPLSNRLAPYKNVFCYLCNQGYRKLFERNKLFMRDVKEKHTVHLQTQLDMTMGLSGESKFDDVKTFVDIFSEYFEVSERGSNQHEFRQLNYDTPVINGIVKDYIAVCGTKPLCNVTTGGKNSTDKVYGNPVCKTCICDSSCAENESCCADILFFKEPYSCYSPKMFSSFYKYKRESSKLTQDISSSDVFITDLYQVINICLNEDVTPNKKEKCSAVNDTSDRLSRIPVSTESGMTYRNIYCYECNNNKSVITLTFQAICETYIEHKLFTNIDHLLKFIKHYCEKVSFVPVNNKLCLDRYSSKKASLREGEKFIRRKLHPSQFDFRVQTSENVEVADLYKLSKNVFDVCNKTGLYLFKNTDVVANICVSNDVNMMSLPEYRVENNVYKNFACFLCNPKYELSTMDSHNVTSRCLSNNSVEWYEPNEILEELCNKTKLHPRWYPFKNMYCAECNLPPWQLVDVRVIAEDALPAAGYKYIFSLSMADFQHLDETMETETVPDCIQGTYDYTLKECRPLSCNDGFQLFDSMCKPILEFAVRHEYSLSFDLHSLFEERLNNSDRSDLNKTVFVNLQTLCSKVADNITSLFGDATEYSLTQKDCQVSHCVLSSRKHFVDIIRMDVLRVRLTAFIIKTETVSLVQTALFNALNREFYISDIQDMHGLPKTILMHSSVNIERNSDKQIFECGYLQISTDSKIESLQITRYTVDAFFTCGQVKLNTSNVCFNLETNSISLKHSNVTFLVGEYKIVNKNVIICADVYNKRNFIEPDAVIAAQTDAVKSSLIVFSFICTIVSLLCLLLTFITYCFIPSIRTIAGKNIMALCISLSFAQALLQFGINVTKLSTLCVSIGILVHLSWLVSFSAMNVCSFHTFKVFYYINPRNRSAGKNSDNSLFLKYSLYMICLPVFMVLATISTSLITSDASDIGYGQYYCFISDFHIFLFTFITPACLIFASNIVFFSMAFHKIRSASNVQGARDRNNFYICLRLCTIVGIAWPLLIIDGSLGITWFSFIVAGVNSLQGVTIFVSFVLNRRVALIFMSFMMEKLGQEALNIDTKSTTHSTSRGVKVV